MNDKPDQVADAFVGMMKLAGDMRALEARLDERRKLNTIITAFDMATTDPQFKCPSYLLAAIEQARLT